MKGRMGGSAGPPVGRLGRGGLPSSSHGAWSTGSCGFPQNGCPLTLRKAKVCNCVFGGHLRGLGQNDTLSRKKENEKLLVRVFPSYVSK